MYTKMAVKHATGQIENMTQDIKNDIFSTFLHISI